MRTLKCMMAYRGTKYHGFQRQDNAHTVQEAVEQALGSVLNHPVTIYGSIAFPFRRNVRSSR